VTGGLDERGGAGGRDAEDEQRTPGRRAKAACIGGARHRQQRVERRRIGMTERKADTDSRVVAAQAMKPNWIGSRAPWRSIGGRAGDHVAATMSIASMNATVPNG